MDDPSVTILIGGEAGQGLVTVGEFLSRALVRAGYEIVVTQDYMSRVRGGHNTFMIRVSPRPVLGPREGVDLLVALDQATIDMHGGDLSDRGQLVAGESFDFKGARAVKVPFKRLCPKPIFENIAALGVLAEMLCLESSWLTDVISQQFQGKGEAVVAQNLEVFTNSRDFAKQAQAGFECLPKPTRTERRMMMDGNTAIAMGAMAAGVNFCSYYPMTPSTTVALTLIDHAVAMGVVVEQAEDEIAALNMALGAAYAGARALVPTAGGGFALMVEALSLAGMFEMPVVLVVAMRPGPATGLPTRTEQGDLNLVLYAGHGEFPRAVYAPGSVEDCFRLAHRAVDTAERWQSPAFLLTDQYFADTFRAVKPFDLNSLPQVARPGHETPDPATYERYAVTESGVSPRLIPGLGEYLVTMCSDEHTPDGRITESGEVRVTMVDKRLRKLKGLEDSVIPPAYAGDDAPDVLLVCWGSTLGAAIEAMGSLRARGTKAGCLHFSQVYPLVPETFIDRLAGAGRVVMVEGNATSQMAGLIRCLTGVDIPDRVLRYDGRPFTAEYILAGLEKLGVAGAAIGPGTGKFGQLAPPGAQSGRPETGQGAYAARPAREVRISHHDRPVAAGTAGSAGAGVTGDDDEGGCDD